MKGTLLEQYIALRYWILLAVVLACAGAIVHCVYDPPLYRSSVVLFVKEPPMAMERSPFALPEHSPSMKQLYHNATSSRMMDHLIKHFDLGAHYRIDEADPYRTEKLYGILSHGIRASASDMNGMTITVRSRERGLAADMANEIFQQLQKVTEEQFIAELAATRRVHEELVKRTKQFSDERLAALERLAHSVEQDAGEQVETSAAGFELSKLAGQLTMAQEDLLEAKRLYEISDSFVRKENVPRLILVRRAVRDITTSPTLSALGRIGLTCVCMVALVMFVIALWHRGEEEVAEHIAMLRPASAA